ncbi:hypothetical protein [Endozoicomonas atrinae]|uniref:hypothetical protein n=2 Tax=Endozoicomonas atrinae TaxID=1333660 RepID=UPI001112F826|nr:hypothetical protein [Endozoicomonas atrinae]
MTSRLLRISLNECRFSNKKKTQRPLNRDINGMNSIEPQYKRCFTSMQDAIEVVMNAPGLTAAELSRRLNRLDVSFPEYLLAAQQAGKIQAGNPRLCTVRQTPCTTWWPTS